MELDHLGWLEVDIATALGVSKGTVSKWLAIADTEGVDALRAHPAAGHPHKLTAEQLRRVPGFLTYGAEAYGFRGEVGTCPRIAQVIRWEFGISYHKDHVSRLMKELGWTPQVPDTRAVQRDEVAIATCGRQLGRNCAARPPASVGLWFLSMNRASTCCRERSEPTARRDERP